MKRDYDRVCIECQHFSDNSRDLANGIFHKPRDLVTGRPSPMRAGTMRAKSGQCGPAGKMFAPMVKAAAE